MVVIASASSKGVSSPQWFGFAPRHHNTNPGKKRGKAVAILESIRFQCFFLASNFDLSSSDFPRHGTWVCCKRHLHIAISKASSFKAPSRNDGDERTTIFIPSTTNSCTWGLRFDLRLRCTFHTWQSHYWAFHLLGQHNSQKQHSSLLVKQQ